MAKIRVHRKGYVRRHKGKQIKVKSTTYLTKDRGKKGKGKPFIKRNTVKKNILGEGFFEESANTQKRRLVQQSKKRGEKSVQGQLQFVANVQRRTNPKVAKRARKLRSWVAKEFEGKKRV